MVSFQSVQMSALPSRPYDVHRIGYCAVCVPCVWYVI
jgi:hypothetical protein